MDVAIYGVGPIGSLIAKLALRRGFNVVAAIDIDPGKVGRDLSSLLGLERELGVVVSDDPGVLEEARPEIVFHATTSWLDRAFPQISAALEAGADVISTCETLSWPYYRYPELARRLDELAREKGHTVLGTGINPGFLLDVLPAFLTLPVAEVKSIRASRSLDASRRRFSFQKKIGLGLSPGEFQEKLARGEISAHVGYAESVLLMAHMLGLEVERVEERQEPLLAEVPLRTEYFEVEPGEVSGIQGYGVGYVGGRPVVRVELRAGVGLEDYEEYVVEGEPSLTVRTSGVPGDLGTAAVVVNMAHRVLEADAGLKTMADFVKASARA